MSTADSGRVSLNTADYTSASTISGDGLAACV